MYSVCSHVILEVTSILANFFSIRISFSQALFFSCCTCFSKMKFMDVFPVSFPCQLSTHALWLISFPLSKYWIRVIWRLTNFDKSMEENIWKNRHHFKLGYWWPYNFWFFLKPWFSFLKRREETANDLVSPNVKATIYPHQCGGFEFIWKYITRDI